MVEYSIPTSLFSLSLSFVLFAAHIDHEYLKHQKEKIPACTWDCMYLCHTMAKVVYISFLTVDLRLVYILVFDIHFLLGIKDISLEGK